MGISHRMLPSTAQLEGLLLELHSWCLLPGGGQPGKSERRLDPGFVSGFLTLTS